MVPFAGWEMPVQYTGVKEEHLAVRASCGLFDVSHMGEIEVSGDRAIDLVQLLITNDIERVSDGQCQYALLCRDSGGVVDDLIVYRFNMDRFLFVVNASNAGKVLDWMREVQAREDFSDVDIEDQGGQYAQLALQGPASREVLRPLLDADPAGIGHFRFHIGLIGGDIEAIVSRTGYTGADGFEIYLAPQDAEAAWKLITDAGSAHGLRPAGLGARDTLRLEMGYPLYGHELGEDITPMEAGLRKYVRFTKDFIGREVLERQAREGCGRTLVGIRMIEPGVPRQGYEIHAGGEKVGEVTSGTFSPSLNVGIAMGFVTPGAAKNGAEVSIAIRGRAARAEMTTLPFYGK